jgi:glycosyltransferase involved in cell wall biosynthesis
VSTPNRIEKARRYTKPEETVVLPAFVHGVAPPTVARPRIAILGTRGIPASHGGFETFAERLALHLASIGWDVEVYCQADSGGRAMEQYEGASLIHLPVLFRGSLGSVLFDLAAMRRASREPQRIMLVLGYNTALFGLLARLRRCTQIINMDGIEWRRGKWSPPVRAWFWLNERIACWLGDRLIADNPHIANHLATRVRRSKISMIPYGADPVREASPALVKLWGLEPGNYCLLIARPEPENSILEVVRAFSRRPRGSKLVVLGHYTPEVNAYHAAVLKAAGPEVRFLGAIYTGQFVDALRFHCRLYMHGHQVGGTNPSLVEALGAGCPVLARSNPYNKWVAGEAARYFRDEDECADLLDALLTQDGSTLGAMRMASRERHAEAFCWDAVLHEYTALLADWSERADARRRRTAD